MAEQSVVQTEPLSPRPTAGGTGRLPQLRPAIGAALGAALVAVSAAAYLLHVYLQKTYGIEAFDSACSINETFNCDKITTSAWGKVFAIPITVFAIPTYVAFMALIVLAIVRTDRARDAFLLLRAGALVALAYGLLLLYVMVAIEQTYCLFCLTMDAAAAVIAGAAHGALRRLRKDATHLGRPLGVALAVGFTCLGATWLVADGRRQTLLAAQLAKADAALAAADVARRQAAAAAATPGGGAQSQADGATQAAPADNRLARKITDELYEIPVHADDAAVGPPEAKVTIVEYADFQCGYCKKLFYVMQNLHRRYDDRVRFVFKHFPMNTLCNPHIKNNRHKWACNAALAAECGRRQGKFWPMHDMLFKNQHKLESADLRFYAQTVGLDMAAYSACMRDPAPRESLKRAIDEAGQALGLTATPRTFLNGLMLSGALPEELLSRMIDQELAKAGSAPGAAVIPAASHDGPTATQPPPADAPKAGMAAVTGPGGRVTYIDRYEASIDGSGRAISLAGATPQVASWYEAKEACAKAGKRLCGSDEWVSACAGQPAIDDDANGNFADDYVQGNQFPYADFHEPGFCHVDGDRVDGRPQATGAAERCQTLRGVFDLAGNVEEWIELREDHAQLAGGDFRAGDKASCVRAHRSFGPGHRGPGIGFRCCADRDIPNASDKPVFREAGGSLVGKVAPVFEFLGRDGTSRKLSDVRGKVVFVTFFASWCGPCQRELPALNEIKTSYAGKGFEVVAVGVDTDESEGRSFVAGLGVLDYEIVWDPKGVILGQFDVANMPTGYLLDRKGIVRFKSIGFGDKARPELEAELAKLMAER